jgi:hypothetical protein
MDEFGISAEHLQKAKAILTPIITTIFNQIIEENSIDLFFWFKDLHDNNRKKQKKSDL